MSSILDIWTFNFDKVKFLLDKFNLTEAKTRLGKYILLTEYYASQRYFNLNDRNDILSKKFRQELLNPNMKMSYKERIEYITNYLNFKNIRDIQCKYTEIKEGKLVDGITFDPIEGVPFVLNGRCYSNSTIDSIIRGNKKDPFTRERIPDEIISQFRSIGKKVDLSGKNLTNNDLLNYIFPENTQVLDLSNNQITSLVGVDFPPNIKTLYLNDNQIISLNNIKLPSNITTLDLSHNKISFLIGAEFPLNLSTIYLNDNQIKSLAGVTFSTNVTIIRLYNNLITSLFGFHFSTNIKILDLEDNEIISLIGINFPETLKTLYLSRNKIESLDGVYFPSKLEKLYLKGNHIKLLDDLNGFDGATISDKTEIII